MHSKIILHLSFLLLLLGTACNKSIIPNNTTTPAIKLPSVLQTALNAHGGLQAWNNVNTIEYTIQKKEQPEKQIIDLKSRRVRIENETYTLGYDGQEVWVSPNKAAFGKGSPRFYHNLIFYFFAAPFVLADPGIVYEKLPNKTIKGQTYEVLKISYQSGVGDAPDDYYIAHFNTKTHLMDWLLYTVTYYSSEKSEKFSALHYEWQEINGLFVPSKMTGYKYADGEIGDLRYERPFLSVQLKKEKMKDAIFAMPQGAEIDKR